MFNIKAKEVPGWQGVSRSKEALTATKCLKHHWLQRLSEQIGSRALVMLLLDVPQQPCSLSYQSLCMSLP